MAKVPKKKVQKLIDALRSGEYEQGFGCLQSPEGYCPLGVALVIETPLAKQVRFASTGRLKGLNLYDQPARPAWTWDLESEFHALTGEILPYLNDSREYNFNEIADLLQALFIEEVL